MRVSADIKGGGPPAAFKLLESRLPTLRGRRFYGVVRASPAGIEEYHACVEMINVDDPEKMQLEAWVIPGGEYVRRRVMDWEKVVAEGKLPGLFETLFSDHAEEVDPHRFALEYYRSREELHILVPVHKAQTEHIH